MMNRKFGTKDDLRIVYMGTPQFAVAPLKALVEGGYNVVGVITTPDRAVGKHHSLLQPSPVKEYALQAGLPLLQPEKLKDPLFLDQLKRWNAHLQVVVAFRMLPEAVWAMPPMGTFNLHASLLPQYRGAAPINWAIINGEHETGLTTFFLNHEIDTGELIMQETTPITPADNASTLHDKMMQQGARLVLKTVDAIASGNIRTIPQEQRYNSSLELKAAPKIYKETALIDWNKPAPEVYNFIRGLSPYPGAWTELSLPEGKTITLKVFEAEIIRQAHHYLPGKPIISDENTIDIATTEGFIRLKLIQQPGKKQMTAEEYLRGNRHLFR